MAIITPQAADQVSHIRNDLVALGITCGPWTAAAQIAKVLEHVRAHGAAEHACADLVIDALLMYPRPRWLFELVGTELALPSAPASAPPGLVDGRGDSAR